ncbi:rod shape-determining protein [Pleomorphochaeta sp. DL1XJH-081]|jgi:rod shape-determining protein MreB|uniref:rod shape-determining protein n=1 Tax=Pleomorphochaeta sp. DL1XJH-081 TaxID=3409690 RepID=UPI003BB60C9A
MKDKTNLSVGIDLGTSNLLIYVEGQGTLFNEPSIIAIDKATDKVVSVGHEAAKLVGKTHDKVEVVRPLQGGVISDIKLIREILLFTLEKIFVSDLQTIGKLMICIPSEITNTEKEAIVELGHSLGIKNTEIEEEIKAAALGSGVDIFAPKGHMVIDSGGGTTDFGILSLGDVVLSKSIKIAGDFFDRQIIDHVKTVHKLEIGNQTAERIKIKLSSLTGPYPIDEDGNPIVFEAMGRDLVSGLPRRVVLGTEEIREVLLNCFEAIKSVLLTTLEETPPELAGDLVDNGILLTGGGSQIPGIREYIAEIAQVPVYLSEVPITAVIDGCKKMLKMTNRHFYSEV